MSKRWYRRIKNLTIWDICLSVSVGVAKQTMRNKFVPNGFSTIKRHGFLTVCGLYVLRIAYSALIGVGLFKEKLHRKKRRRRRHVIGICMPYLWQYRA